MAERNADATADKRIEFRIGINLGDYTNGLPQSIADFPAGDARRVRGGCLRRGLSERSSV